MAGSASGSTGSTEGGFIRFEQQCLGASGYSDNLVDLRGKTTRDRIDALIAKIKDTIHALERRSDKEIQQFCIGKSFAQARPDRKFLPNSVLTWRAGGVSNRWAFYKDQGYDGLVVLGAVSPKMLNAERNQGVWNQQKYVIALESALITHFAYEECDERLANNSLQAGQLQKNLSAGYVVYMAFKYGEKETTQMSDHESSDHESSDEESSEWREDEAIRSRVTTKRTSLVFDISSQLKLKVRRKRNMCTSTTS